MFCRLRTPYDSTDGSSTNSGGKRARKNRIPRPVTSAAVAVVGRAGGRVGGRFRHPPWAHCRRRFPVNSFRLCGGDTVDWRPRNGGQRRQTKQNTVWSARKRMAPSVDDYTDDSNADPPRRLCARHGLTSRVPVVCWRSQIRDKSIL